MKKLNKIVLAIVCLLLFSIPLFWSLVTSGFLFTKYDNKTSLNFDNRKININASCNSFSIDYDGKSLKQNYLISSDGKQLLLIVDLNSDIFSTTNEEIMPIVTFSSDEKSCKNMNFGVYILERDKNYRAESKDKTGSILINGEIYHVNGTKLDELMETVKGFIKNWKETAEVTNLVNENMDEKHLIWLDSSEKVIDTTIGEFLPNSMDIYFRKVSDTVYIDVTTYNYGENHSKTYSIDNETFNVFMNFINDTVTTFQN